MVFRQWKAVLTRWKPKGFSAKSRYFYFIGKYGQRPVVLGQTGFRELKERGLKYRRPVLPLPEVPDCP